MEKNILIILLNKRFEKDAIEMNLIPPDNANTFFVKNYIKWQYIYIFEDRLATVWDNIKPFLKNKTIYFIAFLEPGNDVGKQQSLHEMYHNKTFNNIFYAFIDKFIGFKLCCLFVNCYGFYIHQHFIRFPKESILMTLSDYATGTSKFYPAHYLLSILNILGDAFSFNAFLLLYLKQGLKHYAFFSLTCPVIFMSYYKNKIPYIDCLFRYSQLTFVREPLYYIYKYKHKNMLHLVKMFHTFYSVEVKAIYNLSIKENGIIKLYCVERIIKEIITIYWNTYNKKAANPLYICETMNSMYRYGFVESDKGAIKYSLTLFSKTLYNYNPYKYEQRYLTSTNSLLAYFNVKPKILIDLVQYLEMKGNIIEKITDNDHKESNTFNPP